MIDFYSWLMSELKELLPSITIEEIEHTPIAAIGLDSLELLDLIMSIEDKYGIELSIEDVDKSITVYQIKQLIED
ncbi:acyl carrier protein [Flavobacterium sp.]|jgi:acyl carrier protein|uniref:acyl carrier protein n=1 Tax=Flavobacterium sp. TaxID=239 RepID=UPI0037BFA6D8